jgi:hypothetical protein
VNFEDVLPALKAGQAIQRASQPIQWAYLMRSENGAFHWYGYGDRPGDRALPMNLDHTHLLADDWVIVDAADAAARRPQAAFNCPRRGESFRTPAEGELRDNAHNTQGGKHSCSYCGSIGPAEFMQAVRAGVEIGPTDKNYKAYMSGEGFIHAKFYFQHLSKEQMLEFIELLNAKRVKIGYPGHFYTRPYFISYQD